MHYYKDVSDTTYEPSSIVESNNSAWWNVITFGRSNRCTQMAFYGYDINKTNVFYFRRQHDNNVSSWQQVMTNRNLEPIDMSSKIKANENITVKECSAVQVGKMCFLSFTFTYTENTLHNKQIFKIDDSILPKTNFGGIASDYSEGTAYQFAIEKSTKSMRFTAVPANALYVANTEIKGNIFWYI